MGQCLTTSRHRLGNVRLKYLGLNVLAINIQRDRGLSKCNTVVAKRMQLGRQWGAAILIVERVERGAIVDGPIKTTSQCEQTISIIQNQT